MAYSLPTPAQTRMAYPIVAALDDETLQFWLDRVVGRDVDQSWPEYGADAQMAAAVHRYLRAQIGAGGSGDGSDLAGVTSFKSGTFSAQFSEAYIQQQIKGDWDSTQAGQDYDELLRRKAAGPRVTAPGRVPCDMGFVGLLSPYRGY
jgi:hypothetical protein